MKTIFIICIGIVLMLVIGLVFVGIYSNEKENVQKELSNKFQGPVPLGYDEQHFRETGETILLS